MLPEPLENLVFALERLPGVGPKTASRLAFYLLRAPDEVARQLAEALKAVKEGITFCEECFNITTAGRQRCAICESSERDGSVLCVVEEPLDVVALERLAAFRGKYHVLHGVMSPIEGIGADDLKIKELLRRVEQGGVREVIVATNPSHEGDATALYLRQRMEKMDVHVTRLARGLPVGGELEYADQNTLLRALQGRQEIP